MICRLCLQEICDFKSAFDSADNERTIASIIEKYFWFEVNKFRILPQWQLKIFLHFSSSKTIQYQQ